LFFILSGVIEFLAKVASDKEDLNNVPSISSKSIVSSRLSPTPNFGNLISARFCAKTSASRFSFLTAASSLEF